MMRRGLQGKLVIATHNPGKLAEVRGLLAPYGIEALSAAELSLAEPEETGQSFAENAAIKALAAAQAAKLPALADDSGLCAVALAGAPAIHSPGGAGGGGNFGRAMKKFEKARGPKVARPRLK